MIELKEVTKTYLKQTAVKDLTIVFPPGKIIGLLGENGSGKSTVLKMIAGLVRPSAGSVLLNGDPANRQSCRQVAYLSELDTYYPFYTVSQTIHFYASQFSDFNVDKAFDILSFMKLTPDQKVKNLSKGSRGRLKIVLALSRDVPVILMDEPLSGLDPMVRETVIKGLLSFVDIETQTVIITTHEISEIEPLLDEAAILHKGTLINQQSIDSIREDGLTLAAWMKQAYRTGTAIE